MQGRDKAVRPWCGVFQWPGKQPFIVGAVAIEAGASHAETEAALLDKLRNIIPDDAGVPRLIKLLPGAIFFIPDDEG